MVPTRSASGVLALGRCGLGRMRGVWLWLRPSISRVVVTKRERRPYSTLSRELLSTTSAAGLAPAAALAASSAAGAATRPATAAPFFRNRRLPGCLSFILSS